METTKQIAVVLLLLALALSEVSSRCPPPNQVRGPECRENYDCRKGPCCPNSFGKKNCVDTVPINSWNNIRDDNRYKYEDKKMYKDKSAGMYCNGVKCMPYQACKPDKYNNLRCQ